MIAEFLITFAKINFMKKFTATVLLLFFTCAAFAWGRKGHTMVAQIAYSYLDEATKKNIDSYLDGMTLKKLPTGWMISRAKRRLLS